MSGRQIDGELHLLASFGAASVEGAPGAVVLALDGRDGARHRFVTDISTLERIADELAREIQRLHGQTVAS